MSTRDQAREKAPEELVSELRGLVAEAERMLGESERATPATVSALCERFESARARMAALYAATKGKVEAGAKTTDAAIRSHPYQALVIALGIGVLLGAVVSRRRGE
jgi:ElaB/YqjD/DUF883 family membrane-anchored ribosome-binding protein